MFDRFKFWPEVAEEQMASGSRQYLNVVAFYAIGMAVGLMIKPDWFNTKNFDFVMNMLPFQKTGWAVVHTLLGLFALGASWNGNLQRAFRALQIAFILVGLWAAGFIASASIALATDTKASWSAPVAYFSLFLTHTVVARRPIRFQLEPLVREINGR